MDEKLVTSQSDMDVEKQRRIDRTLIWTWAGVMLLFSVGPFVNSFRDGMNKDYGNWYETAEIVLAGGDIYTREHGEMRYMYPPTAVIVMTPFAILGEQPFVLSMELINSLAWVAAVLLSVKLATGRMFGHSRWQYALPILLTLAYVSDMYLLGQANLVLLVAMLSGFLCLRYKYDWGAGACLAFAAAFKAFPVTAICYLIYRRHWKATASMVLSLAFFLVLLPAPIRGFQQNLKDLATWTRGMVFQYDHKTIAQRPEIAFRFSNQSIISTVNRLLRPVPADWDRQGKPIFVNFAHLDFKTINVILASMSLVICLTYLGLMPPARLRSPQSDSIEYAMLLILMIVFSPLSWFYYGVWLLYPFAVVVNFIRQAPEGSRQRKVAIGLLIASLCLLNSKLPLAWIREVRAVGFIFFGDMLLFGTLGWMLVRARKASAAELATPPKSNTASAPQLAA